MVLKILNAPSRDDFLAGPHGISTWRDPETGQIYVNKTILETFIMKDILFEILSFTGKLDFLKVKSGVSILFVNRILFKEK